MSPPVVEQITSVLNLLIDENEEHEGLSEKTSMSGGSALLLFH